MSDLSVPSPQAKVPVRAAIPHQQAAGLASTDVRRGLVNRPLDSIAPPGTDARRVLGWVRDSVVGSDTLSLRHLPPEVASAILEARAETMQQFFESWAESLARNAAADAEATQKRLMLAEVLGRAAASGAVTMQQAQALGQRAAVPIVDPATEAERATAAGVAAREVTAPDRGRRPRRETSGTAGAFEPPGGPAVLALRKRPA